MTGPARVVRVSGPTATLLIDGRDLEARLLPRLPGGPPVAGDLVDRRVEGDDVVVTAVRERATHLDRADGRGGSRAVVANADLLLVVASVVEPPLRFRLLDRYLVAAAAGGLDGAIALTKIDLPHDEAELAAVAARYRDIGYPVHCGVSWEPAFAEAIRGLIDGRIAALVGHSGVGKSELTTALTGIERATGGISRVRKGRHTTTDPRLIPLPGGGGVIDTAGVRSFALPWMEPERIAACFPEIAALAGECRFRGCIHVGEAGCAVEDAVSPARIDSYRRLLAAQEEA